MCGDLHALAATGATFKDLGKQLWGFLDLLPVHKQVRMACQKNGAPLPLLGEGSENSGEGIPAVSAVPLREEEQLLHVGRRP